MFPLYHKKCKKTTIAARFFHFSRIFFAYLRHGNKTY